MMKIDDVQVYLLEKIIHNLFMPIKRKKRKRDTHHVEATGDNISSLYIWNRYLLVDQYTYISISVEC